jgi:translocation and assembly module TamB
VATGEARKFFSYPIENAGFLTYNGDLLYESARGFELHGDSTGEGLFYRDVSTRIGPIRVRSRLDYMPNRLTLTGLDASAFGGQLTGAFRWDSQEGWKFEGDLGNLDVSRLTRESGLTSLPWSAFLAGKVRASGGKSPLQADLDLSLNGQQEGAPVEGVIALTFRDGSNSLDARNSYIRLPHSDLKFAGSLRDGLRFQVNSTDAAEWEPLLRWAGWKGEKLPLSFDQGRAVASGVASGSTEDLKVQGTLVAYSFSWYGHKISRLAASLNYSRDFARFDSLEVERPDLNLRGNLQATLDDGAVSAGSAVQGALRANLSNLASLAKELSPELAKNAPAGALEAALNLQGTWEKPSASGTLRAPSVVWMGEEAKNLNAEFQATRASLRIAAWDLRLAQQPISGDAELTASSADWKSGQGRATVRADRLPLNGISHYRNVVADLDGQLSTDANAAFAWSPGDVTLSRLDGKLALGNLTRFQRPIGQLEFTSRTSGNRAALTVQGALLRQPVKGDANIRLAPGLESELRLQLPRLDFPSIAQLLSREGMDGPLPYSGGAEASLYLRGPLLETDRWEGTLTIPQLQLAPNQEYVKDALARVKDVVLRNEGPIVLRYNKGILSAQSTRFTAKDTNFSADVSYRLDNRTLSGRASGRINLAVLSTLQPDLLANGVANLEANLAGKTDAPILNGRLGFENASFYLRDVVTGLDKVNGAILFDQNRANLESLTAQAGGGNLQLSGFVGFGKVISYRLQAVADKIRLRYPEGISTTANGNLALTGTTEQSILSGSVIVQRASIGQIDTTQLLASSNGSEVLNSSDNRFLQNLQFDVRIDAAQNVEIATAFSRDVKGEIALRLRGTPQRPALLGRLAVTQGEIDFFGGRYTVSRGEVRLDNPLRISPVINLDLETRVRGVVINMNFSGPASKLNLTYRSDPPLQSNEILALLTVGRNPNSTSSSILPAPAQNQGLLPSDSNLFLGAAVSAGINGRLQRFFGISRVRLDPQLTGIDNVPQARLTLEQQVSRDVTLTYITNLNRTQQQIVRVDWDVSKTWSIVAVRDENGVFGLDLFFRRRLK